MRKVSVWMCVCLLTIIKVRFLFKCLPCRHGGLRLLKHVPNLLLEPPPRVVGEHLVHHSGLLYEWKVTTDQLLNVILANVAVIVIEHQTVTQMTDSNVSMCRSDESNVELLCWKAKPTLNFEMFGDRPEAQIRAGHFGICGFLVLS